MFFNLHNNIIPNIVIIVHHCLRTGMRYRFPSVRPVLAGLAGRTPSFACRCPAYSFKVTIFVTV